MSGVPKRGGTTRGPTGSSTASLRLLRELMRAGGVRGYWLSKSRNRL